MIDPPLVILVQIGEVLDRNPLFAFARALIDPLVADLRWGMDVDDSTERGAGPNQVAIPLLVEIPLEAVQVAVVAKHLGKDVVIGLQAALSYEHIVPRSLGVAHTLRLPFINNLNCIPVAAQYRTILERVRPPPFILVEDLE